MIFEKYFDLIDELSEKVDRKKLLQLSKDLSENYRKGKSTESSFSEKLSAYAYLFTRFPATYAASRDVLSKLIDEHGFVFESLLDVGAGLGSFALAANDLLEKKLSLHMVEENNEMIDLSKLIFSKLDVTASWHIQDYTQGVNVKRLDIVCFGYTLTELESSHRFKVLEQTIPLFTQAMIILEPGTVAGYQNILSMREYLLSKGLHILMPCPHERTCPLTGHDWCHFSKRLPRHSLHRYLKQGALGYEDEKYSYLVVSKQPKKITCSRVLMSPKKGSGLVQLKLCKPSGCLEEKTITKKDKEIFKKAKKSHWGDTFLGDN